MSKLHFYAVIALTEALLLVALVGHLAFRSEDAEQHEAGGDITFCESFTGLDVKRDIPNTVDNTHYEGHVSVMREKLKDRWRNSDDTCTHLDAQLQLYGPLQQLAHKSLLDAPFLTTSPIPGKITTHLDNSGEYTIQITPRIKNLPPITIKMNFRKVDADGQEWELAWRPFSPQSGGHYEEGLFSQMRWGNDDASQ